MQTRLRHWTARIGRDYHGGQWTALYRAQCSYDYPATVTDVLKLEAELMACGTTVTAAAAAAWRKVVARHNQRHNCPQGWRSVEGGMQWTP